MKLVIQNMYPLKKHGCRIACQDTKENHNLQTKNKCKYTKRVV